MWSKAREAILDSSESSSVYIGCDSQIINKNGKRYADYSTVVVLHKDSKHGCAIYHNHVTLPDFGQLKSRLLTEVQFAVEAFNHVEDILCGRHIEIHLDVNPSARFASNSVVAEALGWVRGMGVEARIKPEAFAASYAADHCVRRKSLFN